MYSPIVPGSLRFVVRSVDRDEVCRANTAAVLAIDCSERVGAGDSKETVSTRNKFHVNSGSGARSLIAVPGQIPHFPLSLSRYRSITNRRYPIAIRLSIHAALSLV